jgi:hypothetical protein
MTKLISISLVLLFLNQYLFGQELYFTQRVKSLGEYVTVKFVNGKTESVEEMAGFNFHVSADSKIYHSNIYEIFVFSFDDPISKTFLKPKVDNSSKTPDAVEYILSFDFSPNGNLYYEIGPETYRLDSGSCKLYRWSNGQETQITMPGNMNFINFDVSPDENKVVFQHTIPLEDKNVNYLILYDLNTLQLDTIASHIRPHVDINQQFTKWVDNNIFYLDDGKLHEYNIKSKKTQSLDIPFSKEIKDFELIGSEIYFIDNKNLYVWNGDQIKELYSADKLDYIACLRKKTGHNNGEQQ